MCCVTEYFYFYYNDCFTGYDSAQHPYDFLCCECGRWSFNMEDVKEQDSGFDRMCDNCGHHFCQNCDYEGEDDLVGTYWEKYSY